jgi:putative methyltransferase (TIGR04325 family)
MNFGRIKPLVPPLLWNIGQAVKRRLVRSVDHYAYAPAGWATPLPPGAGNEAYWSTFVDREVVTCRELIKSIRADRPILTPDEEVVKYVTFGYVLALAARHKDKLSVIDYGGNLGEYYWIGKALVPGIELDYHCKELPAITAAGRQLVPEATWHTDDTCFDASYDVVMFSGSLQYVPEWKDVLHRAAHATQGYLLLSDIPSVRDVPTHVITQRSGGVTHLQYLLNRSEIDDTVQRAGLRLVREFTMSSHPPVADAPEQPMSAGLLFGR